MNILNLDCCHLETEETSVTNGTMRLNKLNNDVYYPGTYTVSMG